MKCLFHHRLAGSLVVALSLLGNSAAEEQIFDHPEVAGISGFRAFWDAPVPLAADGATAPRPKVLKENDDPTDGRFPTAVWSSDGKPGAIAFDALQRSLLVRFPGAAEEIAKKRKDGLEVEKVELILPFRDTELVPPGNTEYAPPSGGYHYRFNWGTDKLWREMPPRWHAIAWALRQPWSAADPATAPTYNAAINNAVFWRKYGAQDEKKDRFPERFGPAEISHVEPQARLDVTAVLTNPAFGKTEGERLRVLSDNGFLVRKWETYDHRYYGDIYEWSTGTGGRGILIHPPKLAVTYKKGQAVTLDLPPAPDLPALAARLAGTPEAGTPTAVMPTSEQIKELVKQFDSKPAWMPEDQWKRVSELRNAGQHPTGNDPFYYDFVGKYHRDQISEKKRGEKGMETIPPSPETVYAAWVDSWLGKPPRGWAGHAAVRETLQANPYSRALPAPAQDAVRTYWDAWLMPDRTNDELDHPLADGAARKAAEAARKKEGKPPEFFLDSYVAKTGDWRGNKSFYRKGLTQQLSTQNFNISATTGALLVGAYLNSPVAIEDGRAGLRLFPLGWAWQGGSSQEHIDHYYFAITMSGNKLFKDLGPTPFDRLLGDGMMISGMEELASTYHPGLKRFIAPSSRTGLEYLIQTQDGLQSMIHTLAKDGALLDQNADQGTPKQMPLYGHDVPPGIVYQESLLSTWAPDWQASAVSDKPLPFESISWGAGTLRHSYLGANYGMASTSHKPGRIQAMAQWRRTPELVQRAQDIVTLDVRYGFNDTMFASTAGGYITPIGEQIVAQDKNKMLVLGSPSLRPGGIRGIPNRDITSLQSSIGFFNYQQPAPTWEIYVDGKKVESFPATARQGQAITIKDGVSYIGVIPLPATDLGRNVEVMIKEGGAEQFASYNKKLPFKTALVIDSYNYRSDTPISKDFDWTRADLASGGFAIELGDEKDYGSFEKFQAHMKKAMPSVTWNEETKTAWASYESGDSKLEIWRGNDESQNTEFFNPKQMLVNGKAFLPAGVARDTPLTQSSWSGRAEKNGAVLSSEKGGIAFLSTNPGAGVFAALNPRPIKKLWSLSTPAGIRLETDGRIGALKAVVREKENAIEIDHHFAPEMPDDVSNARSILIFGAKSRPAVTFNGKPATLVDIELHGEKGFALPLGSETPDLKRIATVLPIIREALTRTDLPPLQERMLFELHFAGPFPGGPDNAGKEYEPEQQAQKRALDPTATYTTPSGESVSWKHYRGWSSAMGGPRSFNPVKTGDGNNNSPVVKPDDRPITYYALTRLYSDKDQKVSIRAASGKDKVVYWVNGQKVVPAGNRSDIDLRQGSNEILVRFDESEKPSKGESFNLTVASPVFHLPVLKDVYYELSGGKLPVNPAGDTPGLTFNRQGHLRIDFVKEEKETKAPKKEPRPKKQS